MSISRLMRLSNQALLNSRAAIDATANNIANVNTDGYKRRRTDTLQLLGLNGGINSLDSDTLLRYRNQFVETMLYREQTNLGKYQTAKSLGENIETIFGEGDDSGLQSALTNFWNSWQELSNDPESMTTRNTVVDKAAALSSTFRKLYDDLNNLKSETKTELQSKTDQINTILNQLQKVNRQIEGNATGDLLDQRDLLINELSGFMDVQIKQLSGNGVIVSSNGQILLADGHVSTLEVAETRSGDSSSLEIRLKNEGRALNVNSGELGALLETHKQVIPEYIDRLNSMAMAVTEQVNKVHCSGYDLNGKKAAAFFEASITNAGEMRVNSDLLGDASLIAASRNANEPGNGVLALRMSDLQFESILNGRNISEFYHTLLNRIGNQVEEARAQESSQELIVNNLKNQRDSSSGVSLDEEMTKLIEFETAYKAASRLVQTIDEMAQSVLNMVS